MTSSHRQDTESQPIPSDLKPEQALGLVGLGLMQKISHGNSTRLRLVEDNDEKFDFHLLKERLEMTALALETGAPLSTAEVSHLLGAKPGSAKAERGGLVAKRLSRNVWKLYKADKESAYWRN